MKLILNFFFNILFWKWFSSFGYIFGIVAVFEMFKKTLKNHRIYQTSLYTKTSVKNVSCRAQLVF